MADAGGVTYVPVQAIDTSARGRRAGRRHQDGRGPARGFAHAGHAHRETNAGSIAVSRHDDRAAAMKPGAVRVWLFTSVLAGIAVTATALALVLPSHPPALELPWWLVAVLFLVTEGRVLHFQFRREAHSFSLSEAPFVLGLFSLSALWFVVALAVGTAAALGLVRRQAPVKFAFNLAQMVLGGAVGLLIFEAVPVGIGAPGPAAWIAAFGATLANGVVGTLAIAVAISLAEGRPEFGKLATVLALSTVITVTNTSLALLGVTILDVAPGAIWLLAIPIVTVALAYRAYISERAKHETLEFLFESSRILQRTPELEASMVTLLDHVRRMLRAELAEIVLTGHSGSSAALRTTVGPGAARYVLVPTTPDALTARILREDRAQRLLEVGDADRDRSDGLRLRDAVVTPVRSETRVLGVMLVANRTGDVTSFSEDDLRLLETLAGQAGVALENGQLERSVGQLVELRDQLHHQAFHDSLTGLANRALFVDRVKATLEAASGTLSAVLFLDVDDFKVVNDSLGHAAGDGLLRKVALRIRGCLRADDLAARLGGDEFAILLADVETEHAAQLVVDRLLAAISAPMTIDGTEVVVRVSIGIAFSTDEAGITADTLLRNADVAMYSAKARGKGCGAVFSPQMHTAVLERHSLSADLAHAIARRELVLYYQPIVELVSGATVGFEALVRWNHPLRGLLDPGRFIGLAEETGAIADIGAWTIREACRQLDAWRSEPGFGERSVAVNLSGHNLATPAIVSTIADAIAATGVPSRLLTVELTETVLVHDAETAAERLRAIRALGVRVAIDDFGTGYSSLNYLHQLPVDILKIARDFVESMATDRSAATLSTAMIALAGALDLEVIAEGIERPEQVADLLGLGCVLGQGYWFARPMPAAAVLPWLRDRERTDRATGDLAEPAVRPAAQPVPLTRVQLASRATVQGRTSA
jgi:diguanylate cyclase (GGDEF)-like protein